MRGRKPKVDNVVPMRGDVTGAQAVERVIRRLQPAGLSKEVRAEWRRVARLLADPTVDRLKPRFVDVIVEYCRVLVRLRMLRDAMPTIDAETYRVENGRNGTQVRTHPHVAQINESWRQWRSLVAMLGLSPADERNMIPGQGDLFDDAERYFG